MPPCPAPCGGPGALMPAMHPPSPLDIALIGKGRIGAEVARGLAALPGLRLAGVVGRDDTRLPPAGLVIDCAGPAALRRFGEMALAQGDLWTVGASALLDEALRRRLEEAARKAGTVLRLFTPWVLGPALCPPGQPARLSILQAAPGLGPRPGLIFRGPLREAAERFPDHLNTATAAALTGPGISATRVALVSTAKGGPQRIRARFVLPGQCLRSDVRLDPEAPHPVALALLAALARRGAVLRLGAG